MNRIPKAIYTKDFREQAVKPAMTEGVGVSEAARRLSISMKTMANWVRAAKAGKLEHVGQHQKPSTELPAICTQIDAHQEKPGTDKVDLYTEWSVNLFTPFRDSDKPRGRQRRHVYESQ